MFPVAGRKCSIFAYRLVGRGYRSSSPSCNFCPSGEVALLDSRSSVAPSSPRFLNLADFDRLESLLVLLLKPILLKDIATLDMSLKVKGVGDDRSQVSGPHILPQRFEPPGETSSSADPWSSERNRSLLNRSTGLEPPINILESSNAVEAAAVVFQRYLGS